MKRTWPAVLRTAFAATLAALLVWGQLPHAAWAATGAADSASSATAESATAESAAAESVTATDSASQPETYDTTSQQETYDTAVTSSGQDETIAVQVRIIGRDANGDPEEWASASIDVPAGSAASDAFEQVFIDQGIAAEYSISDYGWYLSTITDPTDSTRVLGWDASTGRYWQLFENGASSDAGASEIILEAGDSIVLYYSAYGDSLPEDEQQISVFVEVYGIAADGSTELWIQASVQIDEGTTAAVLTEQLLSQNGYEYEIDTSWGWYLSTITATDSRVLGWDDETGAYWQFWHNGEYAAVGAPEVELAEGDSIAWYYAPDGAGYPDSGSADDSDASDGSGVTVDPDAAHPDWDDAYEYGQGATDAATPTGDTEAAWTESLKDSSDWATYLSDPVVAHGYLYICVGDQIIMKDAETGEELNRAQLAASIDSVARMVLTDGLIIVPMHGGRLQALTADTLATVWVTDALPGYSEAQDQQALGCITVADGKLYFATAAASYSTTYNGYLICVDVQTGEVLWQYLNETSGYYWGGAVVSGDFAIIADDAGTVHVFDAATGSIISMLDLGMGTRAKVVSGSDSDTFFVVTRDGVLHKLVLDRSAGELSEAGSVAFGSSSTSTPVISDGKIYVGGASIEGYENGWGGTSYYGVIVVIDEATLSIDYSISATTDGMLPAAVQASPLVSQQGSETYVYFTCNAEPGGIYRYRVGDATAELIYTPEADSQNYCMASIVCGADGTLYYINDSGTLFAVRAASSSGGGGTAGGATDNVTGNLAGSIASGSTLNGATTPNGSNSAAAGGSLAGAASALGSIAPSAQPVAQSSDEDADGGFAAEEADDADESAEPASAESATADDQDASAAALSAQTSGAVRLGIAWPIVGLVVGVCGLVAAAVYLVWSRHHE